MVELSVRPFSFLFEKILYTGLSPLKPDVWMDNI